MRPEHTREIQGFAINSEDLSRSPFKFGTLRKESQSSSLSPTPLVRGRTKNNERENISGSGAINSEIKKVKN